MNRYLVTWMVFEMSTNPDDPTWWHQPFTDNPLTAFVTMVFMLLATIGACWLLTQVMNI